MKQIFTSLIALSLLTISACNRPTKPITDDVLQRYRDNHQLRLIQGPIPQNFSSHADTYECEKAYFEAQRDVLEGKVLVLPREQEYHTVGWAYQSGRNEALNSDIRIEKKGDIYVWMKSPWGNPANNSKPIFNPATVEQ